MARHPRGVDQAIARFDDVMERIDRGAAARAASRRHISRGAAALGRKAVNIGIAIGILIAATIAFGLIVGPIGLSGLFVVIVLTVLAVILLSAWPAENKAAAEFREDMPNQAVVQRLDSYLVRRRAALPAPAARRVDAIGKQLPLLENRLSEVDPLDPIAQDARRLMGRHLPELIARYERVPRDYRGERDAEGLTVDERLVAGLDAAREALDEIGRKLAREDLTAFATQGRFIETRYRDSDDLSGPVA